MRRYTIERDDEYGDESEYESLEYEGSIFSIPDLPERGERDHIDSWDSGDPYRCKIRDCLWLYDSIR
jgi:hypothetical protein